MSTPINEATFAQAVLDGLALPQKTISSAWLYDERGSQLFEQITELPEYYPTRTEAAIFKADVSEMAEVIGPHAVIVEYGAGAQVKTRALLNALESPAAYVPVDISAEFLKAAAADLQAAFPDIDVSPRVANFTSDEPLVDLPRSKGANAGFFPGSTIGNLSDDQIRTFFATAHTSLGKGARFLLGFDRRKSADILIPAYDDAAGVTADFNLNLLSRINREIGADFNLSNFTHEARWVDDPGQIEMHIVSSRAQTVTVAGQRFAFAEGETIHTEISRKFKRGEIEDMAASTGWRRRQEWSDPKDWFTVMLLEAV